MLREVALRRALQEALNKRRRELDDVQTRSADLRRRLRALTDETIAIESVRGRFPAPEAETEAPPRAVEPAIERVEPKVVLAPPPPPERVYADLLEALREQHPTGFTVGQLRDALEAANPGGAHSYDAAWSLTNALLRRSALELAGTRPGPKGPIRVFRVPRTARAGVA